MVSFFYCNVDGKVLNVASCAWCFFLPLFVFLGPSSTQIFSNISSPHKDSWKLLHTSKTNRVYVLWEQSVRVCALTLTHKVSPKSNIYFWETYTAVLTSKLVITCFIFLCFLSFFFSHFLRLAFSWTEQKKVTENQPDLPFKFRHLFMFMLIHTKKKTELLWVFMFSNIPKKL